jgi:hypothetical protein
MCDDVHSSGLRIRSNLRAGAVLCYQEVSGYLVPVNPPYYPPIQPTPPNIPASGPWLTCQSCKGTSAGEGRLTDATCEVCSY